MGRVRLRMCALPPSLLFVAAACGGGDADAGSADGEGDVQGATDTATAEVQDPLLVPEGVAMNETAPDTFRVLFETSKGDFTVEVHRDWSPNGADRFYNLVRNGFYDDTRFFRVLDGFVAQFGISGDPDVSAVWRQRPIPDDSVRQSNTRGYVSYAKAGPNTRTTQIFINYGDNSRLDEMDFAPFGFVVEGIEVVDQFHSDYGEGAPSGRGPSQARIQAEGNEYLQSDFPELDYIQRATIVEVAGG